MLQTIFNPGPGRYLGLIPFTAALAAQDDARRAVARGRPGAVLGFECEAVITMGIRGTAGDLMRPDLPFTRVDRGGRATLHNPGQLVIFPVWSIAPRSTRAWVMTLIEVTARLGAEFGQTLAWREDQPGLYSNLGKVASIGVRITNGVSTHGVAINVRNDLSAFDVIRTCGVANQALDHLPTTYALRSVFGRWTELFETAVT